MDHLITINHPTEGLQGKPIRFKIATDIGEGGQCVVHAGIGTLIVSKTKEDGKLRAHISAVDWDGLPGIIKVPEIHLTQRTANLIQFAPDGILECIDPQILDTPQHQT